MPTFVKFKKSAKTPQFSNQTYRNELHNIIELKKLNAIFSFSLNVFRASISSTFSSPTAESWNFTPNFSRNVLPSSTIERKSPKMKPALVPITPTLRRTSFRPTISRSTKTTSGLFWLQNSFDRKVAAEPSLLKVTAAVTLSWQSSPLPEVARAGAAAIKICCYCCCEDRLESF